MPQTAYALTTECVNGLGFKCVATLTLHLDSVI